MFQRRVFARAVGALLCVATVAVFAIALLLAEMDHRREMHAERRRVILSAPPKMGTDEETPNELTEAPPRAHDNEEIEAGPTRGRASPREEEEKVEEEQVASSSSLPWSLMNMATGHLCGAQVVEVSVVETVLLQQRSKLNELAKVAREPLPHHLDDSAAQARMQRILELAIEAGAE